MKLDFYQESVIGEIKEMIKEGNKPSGEFLRELCVIFGSSLLEAGVGGTRIVIPHPEKERWAIKIAFASEGIKGNLDEMRTYQKAYDPIQGKLGVPVEISEEGVILTMKKYYPLTSEQEMEIYREQIAAILTMIRFIHYQDPPYYHSFGVDDDGNVVVIDYGETEEIEFLI